MWPDIFKKAKQGGLNVIQTYVFLNIHEPVPGQVMSVCIYLLRPSLSTTIYLDCGISACYHPVQYNFEGNYDITKFIKLIGEHDMYATLRVGPFIEAEWNYG